MAFGKTVSILAITALLLLSLTSCAQSMKKASTSKEITLQTADSTPLTNSQPQLSKNIDLNSEAASLKSTPGKVALSLIICKLDNSRVMDELCQKNAQDLFSIISEIAQQKSQTLESLDNQYDLTDILASENIYIIIKSNAVNSAPAQKSVNNNWITKFQAAINAN